MEDLNGITEITVNETANTIVDSIEANSAEIAEAAVNEVSTSSAQTAELTTGQKVAMGAGIAVVSGAIMYGAYKLGKFAVGKAKKLIDKRRQKRAAEKAASIEELEENVSELERSVIESGESSEGSEE